MAEKETKMERFAERSKEWKATGETNDAMAEVTV